MKQHRIALVALIIFLTCASACGKFGKKRTLPGPSDKVYTVSASRVQTRTIPDVIEIKGVFASAQRVVLKSDFTGRVQALSVIEGQSILTGDAILKIEDEKLPFVLDRQRAELREAEAQFELNTRLAAGSAAGEEVEEEVLPEEEAAVPGFLAGQGQEEEGPAPEGSPPPLMPFSTPMPGQPFEPVGVEEEGATIEDRRTLSALRYRQRLNRIASRRVAGVPRPGGPQENPEVTESRLTLDQARIDRLKAEVALTEKQLAGSTLASPLDGFVGKVAITEGALVKPDEILVEILQVDPIELILKLPKEQIDKLDKSMEVKVNVPDLPGQSFQGEISFIGAELEQDSKSVEVRVRVANPNLKIKAGMEGFAEIGVANKTHQALLVPPDAILRAGEKRFVYVVEGSLADKREVATGVAYEGLIEIKEGLKASDQVVTRGLDAFKEDEEFVKISP